MQTQEQLPGTNVRKLRTPRGRKTGGQEAAVNLDKIKNLMKDRIAELVQLHVAASSASEDLSSAVKKAAEDCGLNAGAVKQFISARAGDNYEKAEKKCQQLALMFEEIGDK